MTSTALSTLTPEEQKMLEADRQKMSGGSFPSIPQIRLCNTDMKQTTEGEYFIETRQAEGDPIIEPIGKNPIITVLYKTNTYSYYDEKLGLLAWTSDIHGFTTMDYVTMYRRNPETKQVKIEFDGMWHDFKTFRDKKYVTYNQVTEKNEKLLKWQTVLYVLYNGKPYKMFVSNASASGVDDKGRPSFDTLQPLSLESFFTHCKKAKRAYYEFAGPLSSKFVESTKPFYIMQFGPMEVLPESQMIEAMRASKQTEKAIFQLDDARKASIVKDEEKTEKKDALAYEHSVSVETVEKTFGIPPPNSPADYE